MSMDPLLQSVFSHAVSFIGSYCMLLHCAVLVGDDHFLVLFPLHLSLFLLVSVWLVSW